MITINTKYEKVLFAIAEDTGSYVKTKKKDGRSKNGTNLTTADRSLGGKTAHQRGRAHQFTSEEAREAGRKGGKRSHQRSDQDETEDNE